MRTKLLFMLATVAVMALGLVAAAGCASETDEAQVVSDDTGARPTGQSTDTTLTEPQQSASLSVPAPGFEGVPEMIVADGTGDGYGDSTGAPVAEGPVIEPIAVAPRSTVVPGGPNAGRIITGTPINPDTCEGVLDPAPESFELETRSASEAAMADNPAILSMCTATYSSATGENFLSVTVVTMNSADAAADHYDIVQSSVAGSGAPFDEKRTGESDFLTVIADQGGIGTIIVLRIGRNMVQVHNGPSSEQSPWQTDLMIELADSVIERLHP